MRRYLTYKIQPPPKQYTRSHLASYQSVLQTAALPILKPHALSQTPRSPAVKYPLGLLIGSAVHLPCETHNLEAPRPSHTLASAPFVYAIPSPPPEQSPVRPASHRRLTATAPQHRAAPSSPPSDCSCAAIRTTSPAAFACRTLVARPGRRPHACQLGSLIPGEARMPFW